jgi:hypothetical protein
MTIQAFRECYMCHAEQEAMFTFILSVPKPKAFCTKKCLEDYEVICAIALAHFKQDPENKSDKTTPKKNVADKSSDQ